MSETGENKKHRHDVGHPDHAATSQELVTGGIQLALGLCILATLGLVAYLGAGL